MVVTTEATGVSRSVWVEPAGGAGRGGRWVPFGRSKAAIVWTQATGKGRDRRDKKKELWGNGVAGERAALGTPHHSSSSMTGAGPKGEPWESQGEVLLKCVVGKG